MAETNERVILKRGKAATIPQAKEAGSILIETDTGVAYVDNSSTDRVQLKDPTKLPLEGGTMTGDIDMGDNNITTSHEPENDDDVVTKKYVDSNMREYTGVDPIVVNENRIMHSSIGEQSGGPTANTTVDFGDSITVPNVQTNSYGHTTKITDRKITLPNKPDSVSYADNATNATNADNAKNAESADTAKQADEATKLSTAQTIDGVLFDGTKLVMHYGECDTDADTVEKTVNCDDFVLNTGANIEVRFNSTNTAAEPTLNVNDTGAKSIQYNGSLLSTENANYILANHIYRFVYDGSNYNIVGDINTDTDTNTTYTATSPILISDDNDISHLEYGSQEGGPDAGETLRAGGTFQVPYIASNETGHVSTILTRTFTLPSDSGSGGGGGGGETYTSEYPIEISSNNVITHDNYDSVQVGPEDDRELESGDTFTVPRIESDGYGHITVGKDITFTLPDSGGSGGEAETADRLTEPRGIDGVEFDGSSDITHYGICNTDSDDSLKIVDLEGFIVDDGSIIHVKFVNGNTAEDPTMNVNDTGSRVITFQGSAVHTFALTENTVYTFICRDGMYDMISSAPYRQDNVEDNQNEFRNITILESDESETDVDVPVGSIILKKQPDGLSKVYWGTCTTASSTSTKMVACDGFKLEDGAMISIKFTNSNSSDSPSLNVDGTGAYPIYSQGSVISTSTIVSNVSYTFVYHDGVYDLVSGGADLTEAINDIYGKLSTTVSMDSTYYDTGGISTTDMQQEITELKEMITTLQTTLESYRDLLYMEVDD